MLIKISDDKFIDSKKVEAVVIVPVAQHYDVYFNMTTNNASYIVSTGHKTFEEAARAMDKLAVTINNAN